jgi:hypothetical protein
MRPELPSLEGLGVAAQGTFVAGAAGKVAVRTRLKLRERQLLEIGDVDRLVDRATLVAMLLGCRSDGEDVRARLSRRWTTPIPRATS